MRKPLAFVKAVVDDWVAKMSGSAGLLLAFAAKFWKNDRVPDEWLWSACAACLAIAMYRAWAQEFDRAEKAAPSVDGVLYRENIKQRQQIEALQTQNAKVQAELQRQSEIVAQQTSRQLSRSQSRLLSERAKAWTGHRDRLHLRQIIILSSPRAHDGKSFAGQIRMALEAGDIFALDDVGEFTDGNDLDDREEFKAQNQTFLEMHATNVTVFGSNEANLDSEPLGSVLYQAFDDAGVDVVYRPGPASIGGHVAIVVGVPQAYGPKGRSRNLSAEQRNEITRILRERLVKLADQCRADGLAEDDINQRLAVKMITIGDEREIVDYRADFAKAFAAGGFEIGYTNWPSTGKPDLEPFIGAITVLRGDPRNVIRPFVVEAIRAAGIVPRETDYLPIQPGGIVTSEEPPGHLVATLVIGPSA